MSRENFAEKIKNKTIEEMTKELCLSFPHCQGCGEEGSCNLMYDMETLYHGGYRKKNIGKWEMQRFPLVSCSVCKSLRDCQTEHGWNYCPTCGSYMNESEDTQ